IKNYFPPSYFTNLPNDLFRYPICHLSVTFCRISSTTLSKMKHG
ncbi:hypothetical protein LINGRAHAP2_LOCUS9932, partial [Linum grandiflorum]